MTPFILGGPGPNVLIGKNSLFCRFFNFGYPKKNIFSIFSKIRERGQMEWTLSFPKSVNTPCVG